MGWQPRKRAAISLEHIVRILQGDSVPTNLDKSKSLLSQTVKLLLILSGRHPVVSHPGRAGRFLPNGSISLSSSHTISADLDKSKSLFSQTVELLLILSGRHPVVSHPDRKSTRLNSS